LPDIVANKIAAGEIVERPASVVKELLENSIDADCRTLQVSVRAGGKRYIAVRDDGSGMSQDDAILAFEHHATSKLKTVDDLGKIATLGFRGEALPSIASVSRLTLRTRDVTSESLSGTEVEIHGGTLRSVKPVPWDRGTQIIVRDLFFNLPARRKFLRSDETELGHVTRLVTQYALAHPEIRFTLESGDNVVIDAVAVGSLRDRIFQIFGDRFLDSLLEIYGQSGSVRVHGFCSRPHEQRTNPYSQFFYVNRRMVRDKVITGAVRQAYRNCIPASAYPVVFLFIELPFDQVDVNVHPAKTEIRFRDQRCVYDLIEETIRKALTEAVSIPLYKHGYSSPVASSDLALPVSAEKYPAGDRHGSDLTSPKLHSTVLQRSLSYSIQPIQPMATFERPPDHASWKIEPEMLPDTRGEAEKFSPAGNIRILGQLRDSYIIACDREGLLIIDQHVAHERILYEKLALAVGNERVETQGLLVPLSMELPPHQCVILKKVMPEMAQSGFEVESFGGSSILIRSVPAIAADADCRKLISEILEGLEREERTLDIVAIRDRIAVATACKAAIKANTQLTIEKMQWLVDQLALTRMPTHCPHGRPIMLRFSLHEIERNLGRG